MDKFINAAIASISDQGLYAIMFTGIIYGLYKIWREERKDRLATQDKYEKIMEKNIDVIEKINITMVQLLTLVKDVKDMVKVK